MSRFKFILAVASFLLSAPAFAGVTSQQITDTNYLVNKGCSGTLISTDRRLVLTAYHCVDTQFETVERERISADGTVKTDKVRVSKPGTVSKVFFKGPNEVQRDVYIYKVKATDNQLDLAILELQTEVKTPASKIACQSAGVLDTVYAVGNSYGVLYSTVTKGIVSSVQRNYRDLGLIGDLGDATDNGEHGFIQHSAPIAGGNSGGALYNEAGELIGVNVRGAASGFSFAVPLEDIHKFFQVHDMEGLIKDCENGQK